MTHTASRLDTFTEALLLRQISQKLQQSSGQRGRVVNASGCYSDSFGSASSSLAVVWSSFSFSFLCLCLLFGWGVFYRWREKWNRKGEMMGLEWRFILWKVLRGWMRSRKRCEEVWSLAFRLPGRGKFFQADGYLKRVLGVARGLIRHPVFFRALVEKNISTCS